jgi:SET domain-containing protein
MGWKVESWWEKLVKEAKCKSDILENCNWLTSFNEELKCWGLQFSPLKMSWSECSSAKHTKQKGDTPALITKAYLDEVVQSSVFWRDSV